MGAALLDPRFPPQRRWDSALRRRPTDAVWWNEAYDAHFGTRPKETSKGSSWWLDHIHPDDRDDVWSSLESKRNSNAVYWTAQYRYRRTSGEYSDVVDRAYIARDASGNAIRLLGAMFDVTERKQTEDKLRSLATQLTDSKLQERRRLSRELHDYLAQILIACAMKVHTMDRTTMSTEDADQLNDVEGLIKDAEEYTRTLIAQLSPDILYNLGLLPALEWLATEMEKQYGLRVKVHFRGRSLELSAETGLFVFETIRELITNVARHAQSDKASLTLEYRNERLTVTVEDKGVGFDTAKLIDAQRDKHFGLFSIKQRMSAHHGRFNIQSVIGAGTVISFEIPVTSSLSEGVGVTVSSTA